MKRMLDAVLDDAAMPKSEAAAGTGVAVTKRCPLRRSRRSRTAPTPSSRLAPSYTGKSSTGSTGEHLTAASKRRRCRHPQEIDDVVQEEALIRLVFTFLDVRDHQVIRCCSHSWKRIMHSLAVDTLDLSTLSPVRSAPKLDHAFLAVMQSYRSVRHLNLSGQRTLTDRDLLVLASHFWANLESIRVDDCLQLTDFALFSILNAQSLKLRALSFRHCKQLTGRFASAEIAGKHPSLVTLDLFDTRVDLRFITQVETAFPSLVELNALHTPAHREWFHQQRQMNVGSPDLAEEFRFLVCNQLVEMPLLLALITEFERRLEASGQRGERGGAFHQSLVRSGKRALIEVPLGEVSTVDNDNVVAAPAMTTAQVSAVLMACAAGHRRSLAALLEVGHAALDVTDREGNTPLCLAASNGHTDALELLLRAGADANVRTRSLATPLYLASEHNRDMIVDLLLRNGADPGRLVGGGTTALCVAARNGHISTVLRLLTAILQPSTYVSSRTRARSHSCDASEACRMQLVQALFLACESGHTRVVGELLARAALRADELMDSSVTPLYLACQMGHEAIVTLLLRRGADANFQRPTVGGVSCLYIAAQEGHCAVVEHLVRWKVRVDARMEDQSTALHIAARMGHVDVVRVLIRSGAAMDAQTRSGLSPLYIASEEGHVGLVRFLLASGAARDLQTRTGATALFAATQRGHAAAVRVLLMAGASAHLPKYNGTYPTDAAALLGDYDITRLLLQFGAHVGALSLHFAERRRDLRLQSLLMSRYFTQHLLLRSGDAISGGVMTPIGAPAGEDPLTPLQ